MLKIYKTSKSEIIKSKNIHKDCWIDLTMPTEEEINRVVKATKIDKDLIIKMLDEEMAKSIITAFLTIATSVIGFFIGYQTNKPSQIKIDDGEK